MGTAQSTLNGEPLSSTPSSGAAHKAEIASISDKSEKSDLRERKNRMERLRRSFRESFRRRKDSIPDSSKPHLWQSDEATVRAGTCQFHVKYLGCVEVYESRGMQVCEEALKVLRNSRRRPIKGILHVSGDGLRVVEDETKGLLVDQTIEKVSFCAPDRNSERGFSYICRDGTTRRWMCHGFLSSKDSGERLSHAVGCAFAVCLERKQKREKESVAVNYDPASSAFTRTGSFRTAPLTERLQDPQECKPAAVAEPPPVKPVVNPYAIERPHAAPHLLQRQGSFRGLSQLNQSSPFKRQLSLRIGDLPSTLERQQNSLNAEAPTYKPNLNGQPGPESPEPPPRSNRLRIQSTPCPNNNMAPIPESSPMVERSDAVSAMCQQLSQGLSLLSSTDDPFLNNHNNQISEEELETNAPFSSMSSSSNTPYQQQQSRGEQWLNSLAASVNTIHGAPPFSLPPRRSGPLNPPMRSQSLGSSPEHLPVAQSKSPVLNNPLGGQQNPSPLFAAGSSPFQNLSNASPMPPAIPSRSSAPYSTVTSSDPFDADWASLATRNPGNTNNTNPFTQSSVVKTFEVHM